jgi:hypothetical protein
MNVNGRVNADAVAAVEPWMERDRMLKGNVMRKILNAAVGRLWLFAAVA